jgi:hypothetical protein
MMTPQMNLLQVEQDRVRRTINEEGTCTSRQEAGGRGQNAAARCETRASSSSCTGA